MQCYRLDMHDILYVLGRIAEGKPLGHAVGQSVLCICTFTVALLVQTREGHNHSERFEC